MSKGGFGGGRARFSGGPGASRRADVLWAIARAEDLTTSEAAALWTVETYVPSTSRHKGEARVAVADIARGAKLKERQTQAVLRSCVAKGWLEVRSEFRQGHQAASVYRVTPPTALPLPTEPEAEPTEDPGAVH